MEVNCIFFFFQAEDGIRDLTVTGVQTCALPIFQVAPSYASHLLPAQLLGGAGVGLTIPSLLGAGSASLTPARFGSGSGILNTGRQVGTVLGVAGLVAILARVSPTDPLPAFRGSLVLVIAFFAAAGVVSAVLLTRRPRSDDLKVVGRGDQGAVGGAVEPVKAAG